jgi:hypothetical protein
MSIMDSVTAPEDGPVIVTITGDAGIGKTTLAASFPDPVIMRVENGLQAIRGMKNVRALPVIEDVQQVWDQLLALLTEEHPYKTLVIDSVTALDRMFTEHIISTDPKHPKSLNQAAGGYGAGKGVLASMHARIRKAAGLLASRRGMNVVFVAHADIIRIEPPNEEAYTAYSLRLTDKSMPYYVDDVDLVGYLKLETIIVGDEGERKKAISDGTRQLVCYVTAESVSKNRFGITEKLTVKPGENPLVDYIPALKAAKPADKKEKAA